MILDVLYIGLILIVTIIGLIFTKKSSQFCYKLLLVFLAVTFLNESVCFYIKIKQLGDNYLLYNLYYYFRYPILGWMFVTLFTNKSQKVIVYLFFVCSIFLFFLNVFFIHGLHTLHSNYQLAGGIFIIVLCLIHFYNILRKTSKENPLITVFFWVATGLFFYFLGNLPFWGVINVLLKKDIIFAENYMIIAKSLSIFLYTLIGLDFFIQWKYLKSEY